MLGGFVLFIVRLSGSFDRAFCRLTMHEWTLDHECFEKLGLIKIANHGIDAVRKICCIIVSRTVMLCLSLGLRLNWNRACFSA